jgi:hypothetical protein
VPPVDALNCADSVRCGHIRMSGQL